MIKLVKDLLLLARPKQWTKNLILFAGIIFSGSFLDVSLVVKSVLAFITFCLLSSAMYTFNDVLDVEQDKNHPEKKKRPVADGRVSIGTAFVFAIALLGAGAVLSVYQNLAFQMIALSYVVLITMYTMFLKRIAILDVIIISIGFVLRALAGSVIVPGLISPWLLLCAFLLSLVLGFGKRRHELVILEQHSDDHRRVLSEYSPELLDAMITIAAGTTLIAYSLYTFSATQSRFMMVTIPFIAYGLFRYLYVVHIQGEGGSPESILIHDRPMILTVGLWGLLVLMIQYFDQINLLGDFFK